MAAFGARRHQVDIRGLDKAALLLALWRTQRCAPPNATRNPFYARQPPAPTRHELEEAVKAGCIDEFCYKPIRLDLRGDAVDPRPYDHIAGAGRCAKVVADVRAAKAAVAEMIREAGLEQE